MVPNNLELHFGLCFGRQSLKETKDLKVCFIKCFLKTFQEEITCKEILSLPFLLLSANKYLPTSRGYCQPPTRCACVCVCVWERERELCWLQSTGDARWHDFHYSRVSANRLSPQDNKSTLNTQLEYEQSENVCSNPLGFKLMRTMERANLHHRRLG